MSPAMNNALRSTSIAFVIYLVITIGANALATHKEGVGAIVIQTIIFIVVVFAITYGLSVYFFNRAARR